MSTSKQTLEQQLTQYMEAGFPILYIHSCEEQEVDAAILQAAHKVKREHIEEWNGTGLVDFVSKAPIISIAKEFIPFDQVLSTFLNETILGRILVLKEPQAYWETPEYAALLRNIALRINTGRLDECTVIIVSSVYSVPKEIEHYITVLETPPLSDQQIASLVQKTAKEEMGYQNLEQDIVYKMAMAFKGLSASEIKDSLRLSFNLCSGVLDDRAISMIRERKRQTIKKSGILEMVDDAAQMNDIGGLENLKTWLKRKASVFQRLREAKEFGVDMPKGVLIAGVPGCGKSLSAKATAAHLKVPLLRLDMGRLLGKYLGESEANMRQAISLAEAISPCVLWIDELEKAFAGIGGEGGSAEVTTRLLGSFLTWLQEKETSVFVVATANDLKKLPPELLRKGRFDEIFYVSLPTEPERKAILEIHVKKRRAQDLDGINFAALAREADKYSGAELESVVKDAIEAAFASNQEHVSTEAIQKAIRETTPLSKSMEESWDKMEKEYEKRNYKSAS